MKHHCLPNKITEEQENISQQVRNWSGDPVVYKKIQKRLSRLRMQYDQIEILNKPKSNAEQKH